MPYKIYKNSFQLEKNIKLFRIGKNMNIKPTMLSGHAVSIKSSSVLIRNSSQIVVLEVEHI